MAVPVTRELPLVWNASLSDPSGYADEARCYLLALARAGYAVQARDLCWTKTDVGLPRAHATAVAAAVKHRAASGAAHVYHLVPGPILPAYAEGPTVVRTMFETDRIPEHWLQRLAEADEVWVPCTFNAATFARSGVDPDRIRVLPETIDFDLFSPTETDRGGRPFTFLTNFDFTDRKGWDVLLDAWAAAFAPTDPVRLVLKCISIHGMTGDDIARRVRDHLGGRETAPIELDTRLLPGRDLPQLYASADAFVLASRGEGWGRPYMEAMAMGLPTIGSRWSGNLDFMHDGNSFLVDGEVVPVAADAQQHTPLYAGHDWFQPDRDALADAMRRVAAGEGRDRAARARNDLLDRFGPDVVAARLAELVEDAVDRWRERSARSMPFVWRGDWGSVHSLAVVNESIVRSAEAGGSASVRRQGIDGIPVVDGRVGVAQQWPPSFEAPSEGPFVLYQPWEFGEVPEAWVEKIRTRVDEVWTPSEYARQSFLAAGIAPDLVHVVPNGVDLERFTPAGPVRELPTERSTVFLFVGGATYRKGIDLLLEAYCRAFRAEDDVCLLIKAFGSDTLYRGQSASSAIAELASTPGAPEVQLLDADLPYDDLPALYRAADCLVQPYRGEGFCLPALEALACGIPLVVTAGGPTDDFASDLCAWRVDADRRALAEGLLPPGLLPAGGGWMLEPRPDALVEALRAAADPAARAAKATEARAHAERYSWDAAAQKALTRVQALATRIPIRTISPATVAERRRVLLAVDADWDDHGTWAPAVRAYADAFSPDDDVTLLLPGEPSILALVEDVLTGCDAELADVVLADPGTLGRDALALTVDAYIATGPVRARRVIPADAGALRSFLDATT